MEWIERKEQEGLILQTHHDDDYRHIYNDGYDLSPVQLVHWSRGDCPPFAEYLEFHQVPEKCQDEGLKMLPLYAYVHGMMMLGLEPFSCPWDSGTIGAFLYPRDLKDITPVAKNYVSYANFLLSGDVYGYSITNKENGELLDSCWGFVGDHTYVWEEGSASLECYLQEKRKNKAKRLRSYVKHRVPLEKRWL